MIFHSSSLYLQYSALLLCFTLTGCASWFGRAKEDHSMGATHRTMLIPTREKKVTREPGSIWTEASTWNIVFSNEMPRTVGDILRIELTDDFRKALISRLEKHTKKDAQATQDQKASDWDIDTKALDASIEEVVARNLYTVEAEQKLMVGNKPVKIALVANIREKDIQKDDSVSWDAIYNLKWSAKPMAAGENHPPVGEKEDE